MRTGKKLYIASMTAMIVAGLFTVTSFAAGRTKIKTIRLDVKDRMQLGSALDEEEELEIDTNADNYSVTEWEIDNDGFTWDVDDKPRVKVTVATEDDYYFSVTKDKIKIRGDEATVVSTKKEDSQTLIITLDLKPMSERTGPIEYAYLNGSVATWAPAYNAVSYELYLYRDSRAVGSRKTTTETSFDFGTSVRKEGEYYYKVRAVGGEGAKEGRYTESESYFLSSSNNLPSTQTTPGRWLQDETGWRWQNPDGSQPVNNWSQINDKWYYFGEDGYMVTGWVCWNDLWYYLGPDGDMQTNCQTPDGYTVDENGVRIEIPSQENPS